jgi:hypothetical protein
MQELLVENPSTVTYDFVQFLSQNHSLDSLALTFPFYPETLKSRVCELVQVQRSHMSLLFIASKRGGALEKRVHSKSGFRIQKLNSMQKYASMRSHVNMCTKREQIKSA